MYTIKKLGALWRVLNSAGIVQFSSLRRINCTDWVRQQSAPTLTN